LTNLIEFLEHFYITVVDFYYLKNISSTQNNTEYSSQNQTIEVHFTTLLFELEFNLPNFNYNCNSIKFNN